MCTGLIFLATQTKTSPELPDPSNIFKFWNAIWLLNVFFGFPWRNLERENCQNLHTLMSPLDQQNWVFQYHLLSFRYYGLDQRPFISRKLFEDNLPGEAFYMENFMDRYNENLGVVYFFRKKILPSKISSCISFVKASVDYFTTCKNLGSFQLLHLVPHYANLIGQICHKLHIRITSLNNQNNQNRYFQNIWLSKIDSTKQKLNISRIFSDYQTRSQKQMSRIFLSSSQSAVVIFTNWLIFRMFFFSFLKIW